MKRAITLLIVIFLSFSLASIRDGDLAIIDGNYQQAADAYQQVINEDPTNTEAHYKLAKAKTYQAETLSGNDAQTLYTEAINSAREAIKLNPQEPEAHFELARALGRLAQFKGVLQSLNIADEMKKSLDTTLELNPEHDAALHALALWNLNVPWVAGGRTSKVKPLFEQAIAIAPTRVTHYTDYGEALIALDEPETAKTYLLQATELRARTASDRAAQEKAQALLDSLD